MERPPPDWSVIVITRNEEKRIAECLRSILDSLQGRSYEVIVADSASTDRTVEIARQFPVRILPLTRALPLSPAAGRHAGYVRSRGDLVLFMDGDSILDPAWIEPALEALRDPSVGGVAGRRWQVSATNPDFEAEPRYLYAGREKEFDSSPHLGGPALYRRQALREAGGFNPFLRAEEEAELGARLRAAGYRLRRLSIRMTWHLHETRPETFADLFRRVRLLFPCGMGQVVRLGLWNRRVTRRQILNLGRHLIALFSVLAGPAAFSAYFLRGIRWPFEAWAGLSLLAFAAFCVRARGIRKPLYYFVQWPLYGALALWGFLMPPRAPGEYPVPEDFLLPSTPPGRSPAPERPASGTGRERERERPLHPGAGPS